MRKTITLILTTFLVFSAACNRRSLVGKWTKTSSELCTLTQPNELEFFEDGTYVGALPNWKGGSYRVVDSHRVRLETTTGPGIYEFKRSGGSLNFKNDSGCEFPYRRSE
jgi:hypothetical protein